MGVEGSQESPQTMLASSCRWYSSNACGKKDPTTKPSCHPQRRSRPILRPTRTLVCTQTMWLPSYTPWGEPFITHKVVATVG
jgi:hypothetical protein